MKTIKFRAWDKQEKRMTRYFSITSNGIVQNMNMSPDKYLKEMDVELMEYRGLLDKGGNEIYEGDIVKGFRLFDVPFSRTKDCVGIVKYDDELGRWFVSDKKGYVDYWISCGCNCLKFKWNELEVQGNIYENPELLKEE